MAIIDELPGVMIEVTVHGEALNELREEGFVDDKRTVTRYLEAVSGQTFAISINLLPAFKFKGDAIAFRISADGKMVDTPIMLKQNIQRYGISQGLRTSDSSVRKYCFADLETVSEMHNKSGDASKFKDLGTIKIECAHYQYAHPSSYANFNTVHNIGAVSEKTLKGRTISHNVGFAPETSASKVTYYSSEPVRGEPDPAATFIFCYRSSAALKAMLIIPRTPSPPPLEERDVTTMNADELRDLQKQLKAMKDKEAAAVKVKRERADGNPGPRKAARTSAGNTQFEIDDDGYVRESSASTIGATDKVVIELD